MIGGRCREACGKGNLISDKLDCDDGNLIDGDGCSSTCGYEEAYWECYVNLQGKSICKDPRDLVVKEFYIDPWNDLQYYVVFSKEISQPLSSRRRILYEEGQDLENISD